MSARKLVTRGLVALGGALAVLVIAVSLAEHRKRDVPVPELHASSDPAVIARGAYLAYGPAHCASCHAAPGDAEGLARGEQVPLAGGREFHLPPGTLRAANLTSDAETGLGRMTDGEIARALRSGVGRHGTMLMPLMSYGNLNDADLTALISFLRTQPAVRHEVVQEQLNPLGHVVAAFVLKPAVSSAPPANVPPGATPEYGRYLVHAVANCAGCHTDHNPVTGQSTAPLLAGGWEMPSESSPGATFRTPNLTPDPKTGRMAGWSEDDFVARLRAGRGAEGSPMPWAAFARMTDDDLRAIFRYLRTVPAVEHAVETPRGTVVSAR